MGKDNIFGDVVYCYSCGTPLDVDTLVECNYLCPHCGAYADYLSEEDYAEILYGGRYADDDYYIELMKRKTKEKTGGTEDMLPVVTHDAILDEEDLISTFVIRFMTDADFKTIETSFEKLDASISNLELTTNGIIRDFLKISAGKKLASGLMIEEDKLDEYVVTVSFLFNETEPEESKKILVSTLCEAFPLCIIREEGSKYIMANNKGLAKGIVDCCNGDEIELLSLFMTGYEKYVIACNALFWCKPYMDFKAEDIFVKWANNALISLDALKSVKEVPVEWQEFLDGTDSLLISKSAKDPGSLLTFEEMLESTVEREERYGRIYPSEHIVEVVSLRGIAEYSLFGGTEVLDDEEE